VEFVNTPTASASNSVSDPRPAFAKALAIAESAIAGTRADQMDKPTPCGEYNVRQLIGHLLFALDRVAVVGRGENPFARPEEVDVPGDDWIGAWKQLAAQAADAWADPAALARPTMLPWAAESGDLALRSYVAEFSTHTWDLAQATGQNPAWDNEVLTLSLEVMRKILPAAGRLEMFAAIKATMPEEMRGGADPYDVAVPVADDASLIDQLVAHVGRRPA
jgi:uncharacterized protein (TIGR03086 family)